MDKKNKIEVVIVHYPPAIGKPEMMQGIRTREDAASWAVKRGYKTVYYLKNRQRVYADKTSRIDTQAGIIEQKSNVLLGLSERGESLLGVVLFLLFVATVILVLLRDWPW